MSEKLNDKDRWLAAEFAAGGLEDSDRQNAEMRFASDMAFRAAVEAWQDQLSPLLDGIDEVEPPPDNWAAIETRTIGPAPGDRPGLWASVQFWRGLAFMSGALAAASMAALFYLPSPGGGAPSLVATLTATGEVPAFLARFDPDSGALVIRAGLGDTQETRTPELWLIPDDGVPRSLGLLNRDGAGELQASVDLRELIAEGGTLAISLEPEGGSPTGAPTGPVIASGKLQLL